MSAALTGPLVLENPLEIDDARRAAHAMADQRRTMEGLHGQATKDAAEAERVYRKKFAEAFVMAQGKNAMERDAKARAAASQEAYERDLAVGMVKVFAERLRGLEGERSMLKSLIDWSSRMRLDENQQAGSR